MVDLTSWVQQKETKMGGLTRLAYLMGYLKAAGIGLELQMEMQRGYLKPQMAKLKVAMKRLAHQMVQMMAAWREWAHQREHLKVVKIPWAHQMEQ